MHFSSPEGSITHITWRTSYIPLIRICFSYRRCFAFNIRTYIFQTTVIKINRFKNRRLLKLEIPSS